VRQANAETERRQALVAEVARLAQGVGAAVREARAVNLPVEPGVREGREALARRAVLLREVVPPPEHQE
jgi:hypothetical protein